MRFAVPFYILLLLIEFSAAFHYAMVGSILCVNMMTYIYAIHCIVVTHINNDAMNEYYAE